MSSLAFGSLVAPSVPGGCESGFCPHWEPLKETFAKTTSFYNSFLVSSARLWNSLPAHSVLSPNVNSFKSSVKSLLF